MNDRLIVGASPHLHKGESISHIMWMVNLSLVPAGIAGVVIFGLSALWVVITAVFFCLLTEAAIQLATKKKIGISDGSAAVTGILLAYNLSPSMPLWVVAVGSFVSIAIGKMCFGGLGRNIFNPALVGRVFLMASWPKYMTEFPGPLTYQAVSQATPLAALRDGKTLDVSYFDLFLGLRGGCIGEVCVAALLLGAAYLFFKKYISWHIPLTFIATTGLFTYVFGAGGLFKGDWLLHILSGGLVLGAFFMATDYVTSPLPRKGQIIFGVGCGLLTGIIRVWGGYPEGVSYAILLMNAVVPLIDRYTQPRIYGEEERGRFYFLNRNKDKKK